MIVKKDNVSLLLISWVHILLKSTVTFKQNLPVHPWLALLAKKKKCILRSLLPAMWCKISHQHDFVTLGRVTFLKLAFNKLNLDVVVMMYLRITLGLIKVLTVSVVKEIIIYLCARIMVWWYTCIDVFFSVWVISHLVFFSSHTLKQKGL